MSNINKIPFIKSNKYIYIYYKKMTELKMEHVLILVIAVFLLYHLMNRCQCNGFSVGSERRSKSNDIYPDIADKPVDDWVDTINKDMKSAAHIENLIENIVEKKVAEEIKNLLPQYLV